MKQIRNQRTRAYQAGGLILAAVLGAAGCTAQDDQEGTRPVDSVIAPVVPSSTPPVPTETPRDAQPRVQPAESRVPESTPQPSAPGTVPVRPAVTPTARPSTAPVRPTTTRPATTAPRTTTTTKPAAPATKAPVTSAVPAPQGNTLRIGGWSHGYVTSHSQAALDACNVVEWNTLWFAGHNWCGYQFWASLGKGQTITLTGRNAGTYTVTDLVYLPYQGGNAPHFSQRFDLVLQTCKGSGTQLVLATKTG